MENQKGRQKLTTFSFRMFQKHPFQIVQITGF